MGFMTASQLAKLNRLTIKFDNAVINTNTFYQKLCTIIPSDGASEDYGMLGSVAGVKEWIGDRKFHTMRAVEFTIKNRLWEVSQAIERTHIDDDHFGSYNTVMEDLGRRAKAHPDKLVSRDLIATAESNLCLDGQFFYDTDHSWGDSGAQSNLLGFVADDPTLPTEKEYATAINNAMFKMLSYKDDQGENIHGETIIDPDGGMELIAMVPPSHLHVAQRAVTRGISLENGETNTPLVTAKLVANPSFTTSMFDLYRVDTPIKPYLFQTRTPIRREMKGVNDIEFKDVKFMTEARYNAGYGAWWNAVRTKFN